jgi:MFS family permease
VATVVNEQTRTPAASDAPMRRLLFVSGIGMALLAVAMTITAVLLGPSEPSLAEQVVEIAQEPATRVSFIIASLLPVFVAPFMVALAIWTPAPFPRRPQRSLPGPESRVGRDPLRVGAVVLALLYAPLSIFAYTSQYLLVPQLAKIDIDQAIVWYLGNERAFTLGLDLFAYLLWGSAAVLVAWRLFESQGLLRSAAAVLALSGITSILAYPLHISGSDVGGRLSIFSGGLSVVAAVIVAAHVARPRSANRS